MNFFLQNRRTSFFISHLVISCLVALIACYFIFFIWYPIPLAKAVGVWDIVIIIFAIDIVIGPILGFFVYKEGKKSLKFDLSIIIICQIVAFSYGAYTLNKARPMYIVFAGYNFETVRNNELNDSNGMISLASRLFSRPKLVVISEKYLAHIHNKSLEDDSISLRNPVYYVDVDLRNQIGRMPLLSTHFLKRFNSKEKVDKILKKYPESDSWVPLRANYSDMVVLFNKQNKRIIGIVDLRPW